MENHSREQIENELTRLWLELRQVRSADNINEKVSQVGAVKSDISIIKVKKPKNPEFGEWTSSVFTRRHEIDAELVVKEAEALAESWNQRSNSRTVFEASVASIGFINLIRRDGAKPAFTNGLIQPSEDFWRFKSIGTVHSCFRAKFGTPRQGALSPHSKAVVTLNREFTSDWLLGLDEFSHCWIIFLFDTCGSKGLISPPKMPGKIGILASRSPHRPNPIGMSLCKVHKVSGRSVWIGGHDLIDGTHIIDIKPLHPLDLISGSQDVLKRPPWIAGEPPHQLMNSFSDLIERTKASNMQEVEVSAEAWISLVSALVKSWTELSRHHKLRHKLDAADPHWETALDRVAASLETRDIEAMLSAADSFMQSSREAFQIPATRGIRPFRVFESLLDFCSTLVECLSLDPRSKEQDGYKRRYQFYLDAFDVSFEIAFQDRLLIKVHRIVLMPPAE